MQRMAFALALGALTLGVRPALAQTAGPATADLAGVYDFEAAGGGGKIGGRMVLKGAGRSYTGTVAPDGQGVAPITKATVTDSTVVVTAEIGDGADVILHLKPAPADSLNGTYEVSNGQSGEIRSVRIRR